MTKRLTWSQEPEGSELLVAHVDDSCEERSALITEKNNGDHSLLFRAGSMAVKRTGSREVVVGKCDTWSMAEEWMHVPHSGPEIT